MKDAKSKAIGKAKDGWSPLKGQKGVMVRKMSGMAHGSSSQNSGHDDNYAFRRGKGTAKDPYKYD